MSARLALPAALAIAALAACDDGERLNPLAGDRGSAELLHTISPKLAAGDREQTVAALERDAFRREQRFRDAADPGHIFRSTDARQAEIAAGRWTPAELYEIGGQLFNAVLTRDVGFGSRDLPPLARFHTGRRGGPDASKCATCHWRGGPAGAGDGADDAYLDGDGESQKSALARNPIALPGAGLVELVAAEMTTELHAARKALVDEAASTKSPARGELRAKGVSFGHLTARPDGTVKTGEIEGVDEDLVIRPFGWKGNLATVRDAVEDALLVHHGMESDYLVETASKERIGAFGGEDPDGDGVTHEIREGQLTALTLFVAMQEVPQMIPTPDSNTTLMWADGRNRFITLGCAKCHVPSLSLASARFTLPDRAGGADVSVDLARDGAEPRLAPRGSDGEYRVFLFSDLKRHDVGPDLAEPRPDRGVPGKLFLTRPLWGVARSRPYLHDGRAATLERAILLHAGEAQEAREGYEKLADPERGGVRLYLTSLTRARRMVTQ